MFYRQLIQVIGRVAAYTYVITADSLLHGVVLDSATEVLLDLLSLFQRLR
jgi:hypothetical protein